MDSIPIKTAAEIETMYQGGQIGARILKALFDIVEEGKTTLYLENKAVELLEEYKVQSAFKGFEGYPYVLVTCLNEEVVHAMPSNRVLKAGDLLTIDFGIIYQDFYLDMAHTVVVGGGNTDPGREKFLKVGQQSLYRAIDQCYPGKRLGDVGYAIQSWIEKAGYNVVRAFVGHGVGKHLHEEPQVPGFGLPGKGLMLQPGMVLAVEVMYTRGGYEVVSLADGWTTVTRDGSDSGMFEHSVAITKDGPQILTQVA